jgi:hypothetical protein
MGKNEEKIVDGNPQGMRLFTNDEVKTQKTVSGIGGTLVGVALTLFTSVILNKFVKINVTDKATEIANSGITKIKAIPQKFKQPEKVAE